jgi:hypothetical protein
VVALVQGTNLFGDKIYSYVEMQLGEFIKMARKIRDNENFKAADYGTVLSAGRGVPSPELRREMATKYKLVDVPQPPKPAAAGASASGGAKPILSAPKFFDDDTP